MQFQVSGLLFDNDGVLVDSHQAAVDAWNEWCAVYAPSIDWDKQGTAGVRASDMVRMWAPEADFDSAYAFINDLELATAGLTVALPGSLALLSSLPAGSWTICTSAGLELGLARVRAAGLPVPSAFVCGDDVEKGKPAPDPYLLGASRLGLLPSQCVVFEDAVAGVASARAAGVGVVVGVGSRVVGAAVDCVVSSLEGITYSSGLLNIPSYSLLKGV
ncbi:MAG: HAD-IA family hydrolase [Rhodoluna sp.]|nr:HAD-IA family hydrolase [Rhodoluna sp.]